MPDVGTTRGISIASALFGLLVSTGGSILATKLMPALDECNMNNGVSIVSDELCDSLRFEIGGSVLSAIAGIIQVIMSIVMLQKRGPAVDRMGVGTYITTCILTLIPFILAMYYDSSELIQTLKEYDVWRQRFQFYYSVLGIDIVFTVCAIAIIKFFPTSQNVDSTQPYPVNTSLRGQPQVYSAYPGVQAYLYPFSPRNSYPQQLTTMSLANCQHYQPQPPLQEQVHTSKPVPG